MRNFCSPFDERLALEGPPAIFRVDRDGDWRFDAEWTRDCYGRLEESVPLNPHYVLVRDVATGFVQMMLATSPPLLAQSPRIEVRMYDDYATASAALAVFGQPPVTDDSWSD